MNKYVSLLLLLAVVACGKKTGDNSSNKEAYGQGSGLSGKYKVNSLAEDKFVPDRVFFDFDSSEISSDAKVAIAEQAAFLKVANKTITVEGHADTRGTEEYNLALGLKRANAVKKELVANGVDAAKIKVVTFGKKKVAVQGEDFDAHAQNRRGVVVIK